MAGEPARGYLSRPVLGLKVVVILGNDADPTGDHRHVE
jgi:hypothetical protein